MKKKNEEKKNVEKKKKRCQSGSSTLGELKTANCKLLCLVLIFAYSYFRVFQAAFCGTFAKDGFIMRDSWSDVPSIEA